MKNKLFILLLAFVLLLSACSNNSPPDDNTKEVLPELESAGSIESRGEKFIENFPQDYPSFELLEYVFGSAENAPIQLVAIARNKETGSSATLFVLDENGVGQVVLCERARPTRRRSNHARDRRRSPGTASGSPARDGRDPAHPFVGCSENTVCST